MTMTAHLELQLKAPLDLRIAEFKSDPERMGELNTFLDDVVENAQEEAETRRRMQSKGRLDSLGFQNGSKKIGASISKAKTSARTFATRVFTAICNCTNSVKSAVKSDPTSFSPPVMVLLMETARIVAMVPLL